MSAAAGPRRPALFVNPASGGGRAVRAGLVTHARERGIEAIVLDRGARLADLAREAVARGADALGMAGGDGSLGVVAGVARAHGLPFVCVAAGTRNHFALDLGLDRHDPLRALDAFTDGVERRVDVAEVNDRMFLNNVSLGIYGDAVRQPRYRDAKLRTLLETARARIGPSAPARGLHVVDDLGRDHTEPDAAMSRGPRHASGRCNESAPRRTWWGIRSDRPRSDRCPTRNDRRQPCTCRPMTRQRTR